MSRDVEDLIRWSYEWFNREKEPPPTWLPDGEFINSREDPDHGIHRGIEAIRKQHQGWVDSYPDLRVEPVEIRANGASRHIPGGMEIRRAAPILAAAVLTLLPCRLAVAAPFTTAERTIQDCDGDNLLEFARGEQHALGKPPPSAG